MAIEQLVQNTPTQFFADNTLLYTMITAGTASVITGVATLLHKQLEPIYKSFYDKITKLSKPSEETYEVLDDLQKY